MHRPRYAVGIDVETTSLDPTTGEIIDVAAIRYDLATGQEVDRFTHLTRSHEPVTSEITALTGISQDMLTGQPYFADIRETLTEFIGNDTVFAHNASFDIGYLRGHGLSLSNPVWDTFILATVAWPTMASYNLGFLTRELGITPGLEHRAAEDVVKTWQLLVHLQQKLVVPAAALAQVETVLTRAKQEHYLPLFSQGAPETKKILPEAKAAPTSQDDIPSIEKILSEEGILSRTLPDFEPRTAQRLMAEKIEEWIAGDIHVGLIEAGTGTGKTYAYLAAGLQVLSGSQKPVIISTYTKNLQDQLVAHDIPRLLESLKLTLRVASLKGRSNYVCTKQLDRLLQRPAFSATEAFFLLKVKLWLASGGSGDLEEINLSHQDYRFLRQINADSPYCRAECKQGSTCSYQQARAQAALADILVVNHALLARMGLGEEAPVTAPLLIVDEAHHLEEALRGASRLDLGLERVTFVTDALLRAAQQADKQVQEHLSEAGQSLATEYTDWLKTISEFLQRHTSRDRLLLTASVRQSSNWKEIAEAATRWKSRLKFTQGLVRSIQVDKLSVESKLITEALRESERLGIEVGQFVEGSSERIQWLELTPAQFSHTKQTEVSLHDVALDIRPIFQSVQASVDKLILTAATLTYEGKFAFIKRRLGIEDAAEIRFDTPFNVRDNMLIYLVDDAPIPSSPKFESFVADLTKQIAYTLQGRTLGLFTSQQSVRNVYNMLVHDLYEAKIKLYAQKVTGGRKNSLERFRLDPASVLLGTVSFWEGVDVRGDSLSCVIIPRLPFPSPEDPIIQAQAEAGRVSAFEQYALPQMILRLRQGMGRLLRSMTDQGVVVIVDPRLHRAEYGDRVIRSLPPATTHIGSRADLIPKMREWFGEATLKKWEENRQKEK